MSIRPPARSSASAENKSCGSLFGPAIGDCGDCGVGGLWARLAVSPPRSPPLTIATSTPALAPPTFSLDDTADIADTAGHADVEMASAANATAFDSEVPLFFGVCPTWTYDLSGPALIVFDQERATTMTVQSEPRRIHNRDPVTAKPVAVDLVSWKLMVNAEDGATGHVFHLCKDGAQVAKIEVHTSGGGDGASGGGADLPLQLKRVAIVQSSYHPLSMAAGVADASSLLVFEDPAVHLRGLEEVARKLRVDAELGYAPVSECCVTDAFHRLNVQTGCRDAHTFEHATARPTWFEPFTRTLRFCALLDPSRHTFV